MNKQWIGDDHDVRKYCLLMFLYKTLGNIPKRNIAINWMISEKDISSDNDAISSNILAEDYVSLAQKITEYRLRKDTRNFEDMQNKEILNFEHTTFTCPVVEYTKKTPENRKKWLKSFMDEIPEQSIIFFDPNNGIEIDSMKPKTSVNYILYDEIYTSIGYYFNGKNNKYEQSPSSQKNVIGVLIYQHARLYANGETQLQDIQRKSEKIKKESDISPIIFLGGQKEDGGHFEEAYILLLKDDTLIKQLESNFANIFKPEFLKIHKPCPTPLKTN